MQQFTSFGISHISVLTVILLISTGLIVAVRLNPQTVVRRSCSIFLFSLLLLVLLGHLIFRVKQGAFSVQYDLPMHLCDWAVIAVLASLLFEKRLFYELAFFWGFGGTLQALITPDVWTDFPDWGFIHFFAGHGLILVSILYLTLGLKMRPTPRSILRVFLWSNFYLVIASSVNLIFDANYGYLCEKPGSASLMDYLGPWPYYIVSLEFVALASFCFYYTPFLVYDRIKERKQQDANQLYEQK